MYYDIYYTIHKNILVKWNIIIITKKKRSKRSNFHGISFLTEFYKQDHNNDYTQGIFHVLFLILRNKWSGIQSLPYESLVNFERVFGTVSRKEIIVEYHIFNTYDKEICYEQGKNKVGQSKVGVIRHLFQIKHIICLCSVKQNSWIISFDEIERDLNSLGFGLHRVTVMNNFIHT